MLEPPRADSERSKRAVLPPSPKWAAVRTSRKKGGRTLPLRFFVVRPYHLIIMAMPAEEAPKVTKVDVPSGSLISTVPFHDYADAFRMKVDANVFPNADTFARSCFSHAPSWIRYALRARDAVVSVVGLKPSKIESATKQDTPTAPLEPGDRAGIFRVMERTDNEIVMGEDDRHLDFRVSLLYEREPGSDDVAFVTLTTVVRFNNTLGRAYFLPVKPVHKLVVPAMMRGAVS
jgi:hypothetical protein